MESVISKIIYLFRLSIISVAYSATAVKTVFFVFLKFFVKTKKNVQISSFIRILIFKLLRSPTAAPRTCLPIWV